MKSQISTTIPKEQQVEHQVKSRVTLSSNTNIQEILVAATEIWIVAKWNQWSL